MGKASAERKNKKKKIKPVRVAVIGCNKSAEKHMEALAAMPEAKVVAVCDVDKKKAKALAKKYKVRRRYANYMRMLSPLHGGRRIKAVHICLNDGAGAMVAGYCLLKKRNVVIEPPMAFDLAGVRSVIKDSDYMSKQCAVVPPARSNALFTCAKDALSLGRLGQILSARTMLCLTEAEIKAPKTPDGVVFGLLAPAIDLVDALVEDAVSGLSFSVANRAHADADEVDSAEGVVTYAGGAKHSFYYTGNHESSSMQIAIVCEHGEILFEGADVSITYEDGTKEELHDDAEIGCADTFREFYEACREGRAPAADVRGALRLHEILLGLYNDAMERGVGSSKPPVLSFAGAATEGESLSKKRRLWY